ncbi:Poly [ADP-ribose] polymerase 1 (PARP-1) (ADP-ribosyltransferase diphtheria toxin-like 1) (ARTD1) (DNA ADP-ribosyltransferase PARP1) (NAD(+) ADP-ribosyltransferase 1) (ADPRT 1) (Poly[ADP-ribose] synthase 1) (Protein poly-ADP-ribosyltransferase PARP1) [Durusdinium trenchii]|uniref:Poly [ADP-ribose] polymerase n=1 Tax=Durusdinium trenchii TaxID=1381693 RepID=A0ABP0MYJ3_9DINO
MASSGEIATMPDVEMAGESQTLDITKASLRRLSSKAPPSTTYLAHVEWTEEERKERGKLLSKVSRTLPDAPKAARSSWLIFCNDYCAKKKDGVYMEILGEAGKAWAALDAAERASYDELASAEKEKIEAESEEFKQTDAYKNLALEVDKFLLVNRARQHMDKDELSWKQFQAQRKVVLPKGEAAMSKSEAKAEANCINRIALKLAAAARKKSTGDALPVPPKSAYALYSSEIMSKEMKESTEKKGAGYLKALLKRVAEGWGSLNEEQKSGYKATAAEDSERHATEFKAFKESEAYQGFVKKAAELYKESKADQKPGEAPKPIAQLIKAAEAKAREKAKAEKKRSSMQMKLVSCVKGGEGGRPKAPVSAFMLFCSAKREKVAEEVAQSTESAKKGEDEEDEAPEEPEEPEDDVDEDEDEDEDDEDGGKKSKKGKKGKKAKKGGSKGGMAAMAAIVKKLGAMWASAQAEEKATFEAEAAKQKENYAAAMKAWYESDSYKSFAAEVDEWQQTEEAKTTKKPGKSFRAWRRKKLQGKRLAQRQADRERAKAEKMAAKLKAKAEKGGKPGKKAKAGEPEEPVVLPELLQKDPFWDTCLDSPEATLTSADVMLGDRVALAAAKQGGAKGLEALKWLQRQPEKASSFFRKSSADCQETALHHAFLHQDLEMIQILAKEANRRNNGDYVRGSIKDGIMTFELKPGAQIWFWPPNGQKMNYRTGPSEQDGFVHAKDKTTPALSPGDLVRVRELRGSWIRTDEGWVPLNNGGSQNFVHSDPALWVNRVALAPPELQPVSTGFARGRAFRAKKLRKVKLSRGGAEGNQAFVKDMEDEDNYNQPRMRLDQAMQWAIRRGMDFKTLAACCEIFSQNQPSDFLGAAVQCGRWQLAGDLISHMGVGDLYGLNQQHRVALLQAPSEAELADCVKRKASITKKAVDNFEIMPIHCACINPACGKTILEMMLAPLGPAAEDLCKDSEQRTLVHYAAVCESEQPLEVLLTTGFSPHRASNQGITPLMCACLANRPKNVARLLSAKADPLARANERTSFHWSVQNGCFEALDALVKHMATLAAEMPPPVKGKKGGKKPKPSWQLATSSSQRNALHDACAVGRLDMAMMLLEDAPGALHKCDKQGRSPLTFAVMNGHTLLASHLIHRRALVEQNDSSGNSPLHYALAYGWGEMAKLLVDCGHDPDMQNKWRNSPVDVSLLKGHAGLASWYVSECPIQPNNLDEKGRTLLSRACANLENQIWRNLLKALVEKRGADVNLPDGQGDLPICLAALACSREAKNEELNASLKILCAAKADVGRRAEKGQFQGQSAISIALKGSNSTLLRMMLESGAGVASHGRGETLLHAMPERLIRTGFWKKEEEVTAENIFKTISSCVAKESLKMMAQTMEFHGLAPLHSAVLHFNQAITTLRNARQSKEGEMKQLQKQRDAAQQKQQSTVVSQIRHTMEAKQPDLQQAIHTETAAREDFQKCVRWLFENCDADLQLPVGPLEKPWKDPTKPNQPSEPPALNSKLVPVAPAPKKEDVLERSVPAFENTTYFKYQPALGMTTPLMFLVKSGDSQSITWFMDELAKRGLLEQALGSSTLFGSSPLSIAIQMDIHLDEALLTRLASPKAAAVRRYDGKTCLHLAASSWGMTGWKVKAIRRENFKDDRAVAFEVTLKAAKAAGCLDAVDAKGWTALCCALATSGPNVTKMLEPLPNGFLGGDFAEKDAHIACAEAEMFKAFAQIEEDLKKKGVTPALGVSGASAERKVLVVEGMGKHVKWGFDELGAYVNGLKHPDAEAAGIKHGMRLAKVGDQSMAGMQKAQIMDAWKNLQGSTAVLTFEEAGTATASPAPEPAATPAPAAGAFGFGGGGFGAPAPGAFGAPAPGGFGAPAFAPAFRAPAGGGFGGAFGAKQPGPGFGAPGFGLAFGAQPAGLMAVKKAGVKAAGGFGAGGGFGGFGAPASFGTPAESQQQVPEVVQEIKAPAMVNSADACYYSPDAAGMYSSFLCHLTQGRWYFELQHVHIQDGKIGVALCKDPMRAPEVTWISDTRPWKEDCSIGVALDCDAGTARLVMNHVWGKETTIPRTDAASTLIPVLCGQGACALSFSKSQTAPESKSLPFQSMREAVCKAVGTSRLVHALLEAGAKPMVHGKDRPHTVHLATKAEDAQSLRLLSRSKADLNVTDPVSGRSALHISTSKGCLGVVIALLSSRSDVNFPDPVEGHGHLGAALYGQQRAHPRLALHTAVENGSDAMVGQLVQARADVGVPIETRQVVTNKMWLPVPPEPAAEPNGAKPADPFRKNGTRVGIEASLALELLRSLKIKEEDLEAALLHVTKRAKQVAGVDADSDACEAGILCMFCGTVESLPNEADKSLFAIGGGDFAPLLQKPEKKLQLLVSRDKLMYYQAVETIKITYAQPLQKAAARNATAMVKVLLNASADTAVADTKDGRQAMHHAVEHLNEFMVHLLLEKRPPLDTPDSTANKATPLFYAVHAATSNKPHGSPIMDDLLQAKANIDKACCVGGHMALHVAAGCRHLQVLQQLLDQRASPCSVDPSKRTPLHWAVNSASASEPSFNAERLLLNARADVNALDIQHRTPLHYAFVKKERQLDSSAADPVETVTSMCAIEGVQVDVADEFGATPLLCAARRGATISSLYLAKRGASLQSRDHVGNDALGIALASGHDQYGITLLSQGAGDVERPMRHLRRVSASDETSQKRQKIEPGPPLSLFRESTSRQWLGLSYLLLDHGYPFHGAIQDALELGEFRLVLTLLSKINPSENHVLQRLDPMQRNLLHALAGFGKTLAPEATAIADELLKRGLAPLALDVDQRLPLHDAAMNAHRDLCRWLIRQDQAQCARKDVEGQVPVHTICTRQWLQSHSEADHLAFLDMVLPLHTAAAQMPFKYAHGAQLEIESCKISGRDVKELGPNPEVNVPLVNVAAKAFQKSVARLLEAGSDPNMKDGRNATSLCGALQSSTGSKLEVVRLLLFHSADANERDGKGNTPLHYAVLSDQWPVELIMELARASASFTEAPSRDGGSLVLDALSRPQDVLVKVLKLGASPNQGLDAKGRAPILVAVDKRMTFAISALLSAAANPTAVDSSGRSALSAAIQMSSWNTAEALLKAGASPEKGCDMEGHKPLLAATISGNAALVRHLLQAKADTSKAGEDKLGRSALSIAVLANRKDVVDELLNAKADPGQKDKKMRNSLHHCIQPKPHLSHECTRHLAAMLRTPKGLEAAQTPDNQGLTPVSLAVKQGSGRMAAVLAAAGLQVHMDISELKAPSNAKPDLDADARKELERVEATVKRTPIPVHKAYGMTGENKVFAEKEGEEYDALLFKVDLKRDEMRFYHLQLVYETNKDLYVLFTRWGEIGETGMFQRTPAANKEEGMKDFCKVFKEARWPNVWDATGAVFEKKPNKYQLLKRRRATARSEEIVQPFSLGVNAKSALPRMLWRTIDSICDPSNILQAVKSMGIKTQSMPFGSLSRATLDEAKTLLGNIKAAIEELKALKSARSMKTGFAKAEEVLEASKQRNEIREKILELSSRYYELVPRGAGTTEVARPIENDQALAKEFEALLNLTEASAGLRTLLAAQHQRKKENPLDYCKRSMGVAFEQVNQETDEFKALMDYMRDTSSGSPPRVVKPGEIPEPGQKRKNGFCGSRSGNDTVTAIYRISREGEAERFKDLGNRRLLWHGSRSSNFISILSQGLRVAPPEAPVQGYMFGKGIYFADVFSKSRAYCADGGSQASYMLLCDVSLGNMYPRHGGEYMEEPRAGTNSTWGVGSNHPDWENALYEPGGAQVPGPMKSHSGGGLGHSEFIVYDPAQVRMRYLVEFNNFESPTEKYEREKAEAEARGESHPAKKLRAEEPEEPEEDEDEDVGSDEDSDVS